MRSHQFGCCTYAQLTLSQIVLSITARVIQSRRNTIDIHIHVVEPVPRVLCRSDDVLRWEEGGQVVFEHFCRSKNIRGGTCDLLDDVLQLEESFTLAAVL